MASNIGPELEKIRFGHYGSDIRMAIHDALEKLDKATEEATIIQNDDVGIATFTSLEPV